MTTGDRADPERPPEPRRGNPAVRLLDRAQLVAVTTPGWVHMRRHPEFENWAEDVVALSQRDELLPLAESLRTIAQLHATADDFGPMFAALGGRAPTVAFATLLTASQIATETRKERPHASFILAWVVLCTWALQAGVSGEDLYDERVDGLPNAGWRDVPVGCIASAVELGGIYGASLLALEAYEVLQTNLRRHPEHFAMLDPTISEYRRLARILASRNDMATAALTDDLRDACGTAGRVRRLVAALLWTMGLVPECRAVCDNTDAPPRPLLARLVRSSLQLVPTDPLIQYLWLEMKDAPEIDLKSHDALYAVLNHQWSQWRLDDTYEVFGLRAEPSRLYGRTLEAFLAGDLDEDKATGFLQAYDVMTELRQTGLPAAVIMPRFDMLRFCVGRRFDYFPSDFTDRRQLEWLQEGIARGGRGRKQRWMQPELPDVSTRTAIAVHENIERILAEDSTLAIDERERCALALEPLEAFRTGALAYWLDVTPPLAPENPDEQLRDLLGEERDILERIRGAYFLALRPTLPRHFQWSDIDLSIRHELDDRGRRTAFYSADRAREEKSELDARLQGMAERLAARAPAYADARRKPDADITRMIDVLRRHRRTSSSVE